MASHDIARRLAEWRYGTECVVGAGGPRGAGDGAQATLVDLCLRAFAQGLATGRLGLLENAVPDFLVEYVEQALRLAVEMSPQSITDDTLLAVVTACGPTLSALHARGCRAVTDQTARAACSLCPALTHLDLRGTSITEQGVILLGKQLGRLERVWLSGCEAVSDVAVTRLAGSAAKRGGMLSDLRLRNCSKVGDESLASLMALTALRALDLGGLNRLSQTTLVKVVRVATALTHLNLSKCPCVDSDLCWSLAPRLERARREEEDGEFHGQGSDEECEDWEDLDVDGGMARGLMQRGCPGLRVLSLAKCVQVRDSGLMRLSLCRDLEQLDVSGCENITDSSIIAILRAVSLSALVVRGCKRLTNASLQVCGRTQTALTTLDISHSTTFSDGGLDKLLLAPGLATLNAAYCPRIGNKGIRRLCARGSLDRSRVPDQAVCRAARGLVELNLTYTMVTGEALASLVSVCRALRLLVVAGLELKKHEIASLRLQHEREVEIEDHHGRGCKEERGKGGAEGAGGGGRVGIEDPRASLVIITEWEKEERSLTLPALAD